MFDSPKTSFSFLNYQFALALWDKLACLLNQTCPLAAQGGSGTGVSVSIHSSPPSFILTHLVRLTRQKGGTGSAISKYGGAVHRWSVLSGYDCG